LGAVVSLTFWGYSTSWPFKSKKNAEAKAQNEQLLADVQDLKNGQVLIEDRARSELGMIKPNEIFVQYAK